MSLPFASPTSMAPPPWRELWGLGRSLAIYRGQPHRRRKRCAFYRQFVAPGDLCFDIGAHVGNHLEAWLALGARAVAVEPNPRFHRFLQRRYGRREDVVLVPDAVGAHPGEGTLRISSLTPTVSSLSEDWIRAVGRDKSFASVTWDRQVSVRVTTLDELIVRHGPPAFCKIDVEGFEGEVLQGLSQALPQLCFEYLPAARDRAIACIDRLEQLGRYAFNASPGESLDLALPQWADGGGLRSWLTELPPDARSGDVYARLAD